MVILPSLPLAELPARVLQEHQRQETREDVARIVSSHLCHGGRVRRNVFSERNTPSSSQRSLWRIRISSALQRGVACKMADAGTVLLPVVLANCAVVYE